MSSASQDDADAQIQKEETVYIVQNPSGKPEEIIVSDWLRGVTADGTVEDISELDDIENVKGDETFSQSGDTLAWDAEARTSSIRDRLQASFRFR